MPAGVLGRRTLFGLLRIRAVLVVDQSAVSAPMSRIEESAIFQLVVSLLVIIVAIGVAIWVVVTPIKRLTRAAEDVGAGNLDVQIDPAGMKGELEVLTKAFNQMTRQVSGRTRELEELGRAIINGPPDASTLPEVVSEHVPIMFPNCRIDIRIFPDQTLFCSWGDWPPVAPSAWEWLATMSEAQHFLPGEVPPWDTQAADDALVATPVLDVETKEPIGGIYLSLQRDPEAALSLLPAVQSLQCLLPAQGPFPKGLGGDEADRPAVPGYALLRVSAHEGLAEQARLLGKPEARAASDADHGTTGHLPAAPDQSARTRAQGVSVSAERHGDHQAQPGVGGGYHLHPDGQGFLVPGGHQRPTRPSACGPAAATVMGRCWWLSCY